MGHWLGARGVGGGRSGWDAQAQPGSWEEGAWGSRPRSVPSTAVLKLQASEDPVEELRLMT